LTCHRTAYGRLAAHFVLQAEPAAASIGDRLSTEKFSLNAPLDLDRMLPAP